LTEGVIFNGAQGKEGSIRHSFFVLLAFSVVTAEGLSGGIAGGTVGIGPFVAFPVSENASFRLGMGFLSFAREQKVDTISYDLDVSLKWIPLILDYNPGNSFFRLSCGLFINQSGADASYIPEFNVELGGHVYTPANIGEVAGRIAMQPLSPYLGIGIGKSAGNVSGLGIITDAGIAFTSYNVSLDHRGGDLPPGYEELLQEDLEMEADSLQAALDGLKIYPVLSVGVMYTW